MKNTQLYQKLQAVRRKLHQIPETGFELPQTQEFLCSILREAGLQPRHLAGGLVAEVGQGSPRVLLRADMDALPIEDTKSSDYSSKVSGKCHACGHDGHMAMLYGAALLLQEREDELNGAVRIVFQPSEETPPGGALGMINGGVLEGIETVFALHLTPFLPHGKIGLNPGVMMAATDSLNLEVVGCKGHGAFPHDSVDAIVVASHLVLALQNIASRTVDPLQPFVLTLGTICGGDAANVVAGSVRLAGTVRVLDEELRKAVPAKIEAIARGICDSYGAKLQMDYQKGYPVLVNNSEVVQTVIEYLNGAGLNDSTVILDKPIMGGEDFSYFLGKKPGCFIFLGTRTDDLSFPLHHPSFDFKEEILPHGANLLASLALRFL